MSRPYEKFEVVCELCNAIRVGSILTQSFVDVSYVKFEYKGSFISSSNNRGLFSNKNNFTHLFVFHLYSMNKKNTREVPATIFFFYMYTQIISDQSTFVRYKMVHKFHLNACLKPHHHRISASSFIIRWIRVPYRSILPNQCLSFLKEHRFSWFTDESIIHDYPTDSWRSFP